MELIRSILGLFRFNNKNWKAILLCVFAAAIFWIFNSLNKSYSASIDFPLAFDFDEEAYIPVKPLPREVKLNVSGLGWDLLRKSSGLKVPPLRIPLENPSEVKKIVGATLPPLFTTQMEGLQINFVMTDTLHIQIDPKIKWKVLVTLDSVDQYIREGYGLSSAVSIVPDSVWLEGPQSLLQAFSKKVALQPDIRNVNSQVNEIVEIGFPGDLIFANPNTVNIRFSVSRLIQRSDSADLEILNMPKGLKSTSGISKVHYRYAIPEDHQDLPMSTQALLDLYGLSKGTHKLVPQLINLPPFVRHVAVDTLHISF